MMDIKGYVQRETGQKQDDEDMFDLMFAKEQTNEEGITMKNNLGLMQPIKQADKNNDSSDGEGRAAFTQN